MDSICFWPWGGGRIEGGGCPSPLEAHSPYRLAPTRGLIGGGRPLSGIRPEDIFRERDQPTHCRRCHFVPKPVPFVPLGVPLGSATRAVRSVWRSARVRDPCRSFRFSCRSCRFSRLVLCGWAILGIISACVSAVGCRLLAAGPSGDWRLPIAPRVGHTVAQWRDGARW